MMEYRKTTDEGGLVQRDSAWRRRAFGAAPFQPTPNFLKILNFLFTLNRPLSSKVMLPAGFFLLN
ncbi:hypothetical protein SAMN00777080_0892 [Aquiflexum balticum DSM 16537]|uniref:Uncharacterized protein n=1 Tax=Aquiflexum balticum DSM 16537 TaxID=758820 RepID=A0A1W2H082_9BACT|nr:hypothetical protein SAMN00777080_0892 [Aquiflexum balticum DSM 16537]